MFRNLEIYVPAFDALVVSSKIYVQTKNSLGKLACNLMSSVLYCHNIHFLFREDKSVF